MTAPGCRLRRAETLPTVRYPPLLDLVGFDHQTVVVDRDNADFASRRLAVRGGVAVKPAHIDLVARCGRRGAFVLGSAEAVVAPAEHPDGISALV